MSDEVIALALGTVLAVGALAYVLYPLFFDTDAVAPGSPPIASTQGTLDVEEQVRAYRAARPECSRCGLRPERDAIYCSTCGARLAPPAT